MAISKLILNGEVQMDVTSDTVTAGSMLSGTTATKNDGTKATGTIATKTSSDLTVSGATVTAPAGYYANAASKAVATATHPNPAASIASSTGVVTASHTQTAGYITAGTTTGTLNLTTQAGKTVTPTETAQTAVASYRWTTGTVSVAAISSTYVGTGVAKKSAADLTVNGSTVTAPIGYYSSAVSKAVAAGSAFPPAVTITKAPTFSMNSSTGVVTASYTGSSSITPTITSGYITAGTAGTISTTGTSTYQLTSKAAETIYPSTADQTIASYRWLTGTQTIKSVTTSNLTAENIAEGVVVKVGDSSNASRITQITGTHSGGTNRLVIADDSFEVGVLDCKIFVNGLEETIQDGAIYSFTEGEQVHFRVVDGGKIYYNNKQVASSDGSANYYLKMPSANLKLSYGDVNNYSTIYIETENTYNCVLTNDGANYMAYVRHNNVSYYTAGDTFTFSPGDTISFIINYGNSNRIIINGDVVSSGSGSNGAQYDLVTPACNLTISFSLNGSAVSTLNITIPSIDIIENGIHEVGGYGYANVTVQGGGYTADQIAMRTISGSISGDASVIGSNVFQYCSALTAAYFPQVTTISINAFYQCSSLAIISFPATTSIGGSAFAYCYALMTANFPSAISINSYAFYRCSSLTTASFPAATSIGNYAFYQCYALTTASFPATTNIGGSAFYRCSSLATISFPSATSINAGVFMSCCNLLSLYLLGSSVASLASINTFYSTPISNYTTSTGGVYGSIFVPASLYNSYITATNWATYSARIVSV